MHFIHVVEFLRHVALLRYRLRMVDPFPHELVVTTTAIVRVVGKILRVGEKSEITVRVLVAVVELEVGPGCSVPLHGRFGFGLEGSKLSRKKSNVDIRLQTMVVWSFVAFSVGQLEVKLVSVFVVG